MPHGVVPRDYPKKAAEPPSRIESVLEATISFLQRKTDTQTFVALRLSECEELSRNGSRFVEPFEKCVIHHDWIQCQVQKHARIPEKTVYIRKGCLVPITKPTLILFCVKSTILTRQHVPRHQTVTEGSQTVYRSGNLIQRQERCRRMRIANSRQYFNFSWIALIKQSSQAPSSYRSVCDSCIFKITKHQVDEMLLLLRMTSSGDC